MGAYPSASTAAIWSTKASSTVRRIERAMVAEEMIGEAAVCVVGVVFLGWLAYGQSLLAQGTAKKPRSDATRCPLESHAFDERGTPHGRTASASHRSHAGASCVVH